MFGVSLGIMDGAGGAAGGSFESIQTVTGVGATLSFTSIPSTYKHLQIRGLSSWLSATAGVGEYQIQFNSDTGANYNGHYLLGDGGGASAGGAGYTDRLQILNASSRSFYTNMFGTSIVDIQDYANISKNKTVRYIAGQDFNSGNTNSRITLGSGLWINTSAITRIDILSQVTFIAGTTFSLYGIRG